MAVGAKGDLILLNVGRLVTMDPAGPVREDVSVLARGGTVVWIGPEAERPPTPDDVVLEELDCWGGTVLPGLVDCHTHAIFGGDRVGEFELRASGVDYETIARQGGGIRSTVAATRAASEDALFAAAWRRLDAMLDRGVTTVEVKSGYGLSLEHERKMLRVAARLGAAHPIRVVPTFLGAHTVPAEYAGRADAYVDRVCEEMIPAVAAEGLAVFCDVFCERGVFDVAASRRVLEAGLRHGLRPKVHAEQLHRTGGAALGAALGAVSVDHLEQVTDADIERLAEAGTVAVLLPGATLFLGLDAWAPGRRLVDAGVPVALATDLNPGSCMCDDLPLITTLACTRLGLSPSEALRGVTAAAAAALGLSDVCGVLRVGGAADMVVYEERDERQIPYRFGRVQPLAVVAGGDVVRGPGTPGPLPPGRPTSA